MKKMTRQTMLSILFLSAIILTTASCSKNEKCNKAYLSFNNHLNTKIKITIRDLTKILTIDAGKTRTVEVRPNKNYPFTITDYYTGAILLMSDASADFCIYKKINVK